MESAVLGLVLVAAFHAIPGWLLSFVPAQRLYHQIGAKGFWTLYDGLTGVMPLLLCLSAPQRSGLTLGRWGGEPRR
ncbi:MAG: hypothetical protein J5J06_19030 [Phycisphaerae bacterium]|nr:hypothetical protein [Phycisphaerae bacterium]